MGRIYTIISTPCGVTITSFEDGLLTSGLCDATQFGSEHFCFGKIYSPAGVFESPDKASVTFNFDEHTFTVQGNLGTCTLDLFVCDECHPSSEVAAFADLPDAPPDVSAPDFGDDEEELSEEDVPATQIIPGEGRPNWLDEWNASASPTEFGVDTLCEDEKALTDWPGGTALPVCESNDNPATVSLPSGHTIVAYESRSETGLTKISLAILSSSVHEDVRYYRRLSKGTFLNNLAETGGVGHFEVYDDVLISADDNGVPNFATRIGFLTGPMAGSVRSVTKFTRSVDKARITSTFNFSTSGQDISFPDKNDIHDVQWFLLDDQGSEDLPPPNQSNVITTITLPNHLNSAGDAVPVANPSIAVARNNLMTQPEQVIYVSYQAYESNQWRVYLREIVLGSQDEGNPTYLSPYLFDDSQRQIELMQLGVDPAFVIQPFELGESVWDYDFRSFVPNERIGVAPNPNGSGSEWREIIDQTSNPVPTWSMWDTSSVSNQTMINSNIYLCDANTYLPPELQPCFENAPTGRPTCIGVWNSRGSNDFIDHCAVGPQPGDTTTSISGFTRTLAQKASLNFFDSPDRRSIDWSTTLKFAIFPNDDNLEIMPEVWFWWGKPVTTLTSHAGQWRLQILRGIGTIQTSAGVNKHNIGRPADQMQSTSCGIGGCGQVGCFVFRLYDKFNRATGVNGIDHVNDTSDAVFDDGETVLRESWRCVLNEGVEDYVLETGWNEWRVESYLRGFARYFDIYLTNSSTNGDLLMAQFREWDPLLFGDIDSTTTYDWGDYHGFGFAHGNDESQIIIDRVKHDVLASPTVFEQKQNITLDGVEVNEGHVFYEDDLARDEWLKDDAIALTDTTIQSGSALPGSSHHIHNFVSEAFGAPGEWHPTAWQYTRMFHCNGGEILWYPHNDPNLRPNPHGAAIGLERLDWPGLGVCSTSSLLSGTNGLWSYSVLNATTHDLNGTDQSNNVSMVIAMQESGHFGSPHLWFVMRLIDKDSDWWTGYRVRISNFLARTNHDATTTPNGGDRPAILASEEYWKLSVYDPNFATSSFDYTDPVDDEVYIKIVSGTPGAGETNIPRSSVIDVNPTTFYRVDFTIENGPFARIKIYVGKARERFETGVVKWDEIDYELLHTFDRPTISGGSLERPRYGFALFSGSQTDPDMDDFAYEGLGYLEYIKLEKLPETGPPTGACCRSIGGCDDDIESANCVSPDVWVESDTCSNFDCTTEIPVGAACKDSGAVNCIENVTEAEANNQGFGLCDGCGWQQGVDCAARGCPGIVTTGSCCRPRGDCIEEVTFETCSFFYGQNGPGANWREGFDCPAQGGPPCPDHSQDGACCVPQGCIIATENDCTNQSGTFMGVATDCGQDLCVGACCDGTTCTQESQSDCELGGRTFLGYGVSCTGPNPCVTPDPIGACCFPDNSCLDVIESACNGTWFDSLLCYNEPCPQDTPTGACCDPMTGTCENDVEEIVCAESGRSYQGDGTTCAIVECPQPTGACCINFECQEGLTFSECSASNGTYFGNFSQCIPNICTQDLDLGDSPYVTTDIVFKPEDLWRIEVSDEQYITRVKYHMQEEILVSSTQLNEDGSSGGNNTVDFMFLIDHSGSMDLEIEKVQQAVPTLASDMVAKGLDVRFGFTIFGRGGGAVPIPQTFHDCGGEYYFSGLQPVPDGACHSGGGLGDPGEPGFTRNVDYLQQALDCWFIQSGSTAPWAAINFAVNSALFSWRDSASKFVFFVTDTHDESGCESFGGGAYVNDKTTAKNTLLDNNVVFIPAIDPSDLAVYQDVAVDSGWDGDIFDVNSDDYGSIFEAVVAQIDSIIRVDHSTIIERAQPGTDSTFLKKAEVIITYDGDLTDLWTFEKSDFQFKDDHVPFPGTATKGLTNFPFDLATGSTYGIDSVHIQGIADNWVSFGAEGPLNYDYPDGVGFRASAMADTPILISNNSAHPKVFVNNRNQVIVAYENYSSGTPQINIKGTGDFHQDSITGPKASRVQRFVTPSDFSYSHAITLPGEGMNQICDFLVDNSDITHIVWQSNRDTAWEIYYANSYDLFNPVRITKSDSRSGSPSISVDDSGSIFVVYHDDRFGPFNVMMASKDEERIIPLIEQDAYMASLRNKYTHYTNILPVFIDNPSEAAPLLGQFWGSKIASDSGNDSENAVYKLDETTGVPSDGVRLPGALFPTSVAFSSTVLWGVNVAGVLSRIGTVGDDKEVTINEQVIAAIDLTRDGFENAEVLDISVDQFNRLWLLVYDEEDAGGGVTGFPTTSSDLPLTTMAAGDGWIRLFYIDALDGSVIATTDGTPAESSDYGGLTVTSDNRFYVVYHRRTTAEQAMLISNGYPTISGGVATFNMSGIDIPSDPGVVAMTSDALDVLHVVSSDNDLYTMSKVDGSTTLLTSLTSGSGDEVALPVGTTSGIAYQNLETEQSGGDQYFHIRVDFYDNIAFEGDPFLSVDSRDNLEAFINDEVLSDPYFDPYGTVQGLTARGIFVPLDTIGIVFFDATHFVPGFTRLAQPFSFEPNQTYFPRVFAINDTGNPRESGVPQPNSFSCSKCSRFGNNNFNANVCSYSFVTQNVSASTRYYNFQIDFYADTGKQHLIRRFEASPGSDDLAYMEVDNVPATEVWTDSGLPIGPGDAPFIQIHPVLDPQAGFLCGVIYTAQVNQCFSSEEEECSDFSILSPENWISTLVGETLQTVSLEVPNDDVITLGLSMAVINNTLALAWVDDDFNVMYSEFDGESWQTQLVFSPGVSVYVSLTAIQNQPALNIVAFGGPTKLSIVMIYDGTRWNVVPGNTIFQTTGDFPLPKTLVEYNSAPMVTFISTGIFGQASWTTPDSSITFDTDSSCGDPPVGSCITDNATINGLPAVVYTGLGRVKYAEWNEDNENFGSPQIVHSSSHVYWGHMGIAEINGQPAVAYIKVAGSQGRLAYSRFNGSNWQETIVTAPLDFNKHISMTSINGVPSIVYSTKQSATTSDLRYATLVGSQFTNEIVDADLSVIDPIVQIEEFQNAPVVTISSNPFRIYFYRQEVTTSIREIQPVFFCECASKIFTNRLTHLNEVARWEASAHGFADTRVTDSPADSLRPVISTRTSNAAVILWEDNNLTDNCSSPPCIRAATFRNVNQDQLRGSGTQSWFDYDFGISGQDPTMTLDLYDRVNAIYEKAKPPDPVTGFHGKKLSRDELPANELYRKVCDFALDAESQAPPGGGTAGCDISSLESNIITFDEFVSSQIVRKIRVKDEFVSYYTYNASGVLTPIVSSCNLVFEIHGTPEIVALRLKNENSTVFGSWCAWSPQISDFVMEKEHKISGSSGVKEVCIQAMTYGGITTEFCIPIVADYETVVFESKFFKDTPEVADFKTVQEVDGELFFPADLDEKLVELPLSEGISVANLAPTSAENMPIQSKVLVEIVPNEAFTDPTIQFDVVQQGSNDTLGLIAQRGKNNDGRVVYRGDFVIEREDNVFNVDGLARVNPTFPSACEEQGTGSGGAEISDQFTRDEFNVMGEDLTVEATETVDALADYRQTVSGRIGVTVDVRSTDDPYFVFGDPNYSRKQSEGSRPGIPFEIAKTEVSVGESIEQEVPFCPPPDPNDPNLGCPEGSEWDPDNCECTQPGA